MKNEKLKIRTGYVITCFVIASIAIAGCAKKEAPKPKDAKAEAAAGNSAKPEDDVQHKIMSFNLEGLTEKGTKNWDVTGKSAESVTETKVKLNDIVANAYGEEAQATITADKGIYDKTKNNVTLEEHVKATIVNTRGTTSDLMDFSGDPLKKSPTPSGNDNKKLEKTKTVITCDGEVVFDYENNQAFFNKNVKVKTEDGTIDADRITVYLDRATRKITNIVAEGNVKITSGENVTYSEKAAYVEADKKVMLTGRPKLVIYQEGGLEKNLIGGK